MSIHMKEPEWVYPFLGMEVGDSFFIPTLTPSPITYSVIEAAKEQGLKIKVYPAMVDNIMGLRIWRIN